MGLAEYTAVTNDIKFVEIVVQELEEKKISLALRCWKAKVECYCIPVDFLSFIP